MFWNHPCSKMSKHQSMFSTEDSSWKLLKNFKNKLQWVVALKNLKHRTQSLQFKVLTLIYAALLPLHIGHFFHPSWQQRSTRVSFPNVSFFLWNLTSQGENVLRWISINSRTLRGFFFVCFSSRYNINPVYTKAPPLFFSLQPNPKSLVFERDLKLFWYSIHWSQVATELLKCG